MSPDDPDDLDDALRDALGHDEGRTPPAAGIDKIRSMALEHSRVARADNATPISAAPSRSTTSRRQLILGAVAAGTGIVVGSAATIALTDGDGTTTESDGIDVAAESFETISFRATGSGSAGTISRSALINHSWGVELVLDIADLPAGEDYDVAYTDIDGRTLSAGSFRSVSDVLMRCRFNTAMLRADTARIDIATSSGDVVATAALA